MSVFPYSHRTGKFPTVFLASPESLVLAFGFRAGQYTQFHEKGSSSVLCTAGYFRPC